MARCNSFVVLGVVALAGCNALAGGSQAPAGQQVDHPIPAPTIMPFPHPGMGPQFFGNAGGAGGVAGGAAPPPVRSEVPPVPINGGTLLVSDDGRTAVAADPDRDRLVIVDLELQQVITTLALEPGDEPGRLVQDGNRRVHVVLRRAGAVASIDLESQLLIGRRAVCPVPQGIAYQAAGDALHVACTGGELVTLPAAGGPAARQVHVDMDLRDVLVSGDRLFVTRFKSAELLELDASGAVVSRKRPEPAMGSLSAFRGMAPPPPDGIDAPKTFDAAVAWRTLVTPGGTFSMLHQRVQVDAIEIGLTEEPPAGADGSAGSGMDICLNCAGTGAPGGGGSAYGGGGLSCDTIVRSTVTELGGPGGTTGPILAGITMAVDAALSPDGRWLAVAVAGSSPTSNASNELGFQVGAVVLPASGLETPLEMPAACHLPAQTIEGAMLAGGQVVAVAFDPSGNLVMQTRDPNRIRVVSTRETMGCVGCEDYRADIDLGGQPRRDTGHDLFHMDAGAGLACGSCHPVGGDDGHAWSFSGLGLRRTQLLNMGIRDTLPLHWDGSLATFDELVSEVFVQRMGGRSLQPTEVTMMADWIESLVPNVPMRAHDDPAAVRGQHLFESTEVGCTGCHSGPKLTNNTTVDVGTGGPLQVPTLIGVVYHHPYLHAGCAQTLRDRFDPACGGEQHGQTAQLSENQIDDLVAYLESL